MAHRRGVYLVAFVLVLALLTAAIARPGPSGAAPPVAAAGPMTLSAALDTTRGTASAGAVRAAGVAARDAGGPPGKAATRVGTFAPARRDGPVGVVTAGRNQAAPAGPSWDVMAAERLAAGSGVAVRPGVVGSGRVGQSAGAAGSGRVGAQPVEPAPPGRAGQPGETPGWRPPLSGARLIRRFDPPAQRWLAGHRGVDLAAMPGQKVLAAGRGVVGLAERVAGRGVVTIFHAGGLRTTYLPVRASVRPGEVVEAGQVIGIVEDGAGVHGGAFCLHWGLLRGRRYLDPLLLFGGGQVRLLPRWRVSGAGEPGDE